MCSGHLPLEKLAEIMAESSHKDQGNTCHLYEFEDNIPPQEFHTLRQTGHLKQMGGKFYFCDNAQSRQFHTHGRWITMDKDKAEKELTTVSKESDKDGAKRQGAMGQGHEDDHAGQSFPREQSGADVPQKVQKDSGASGEHKRKGDTASEQDVLGHPAIIESGAGKSAEHGSGGHGTGAPSAQHGRTAQHSEYQPARDKGQDKDIEDRKERDKVKEQQQAGSSQGSHQQHHHGKHKGDMDESHKMAGCEHCGGAQEATHGKLHGQQHDSSTHDAHQRRPVDQPSDAPQGGQSTSHALSDTHAAEGNKDSGAAPHSQRSEDSTSSSHHVEHKHGPASHPGQGHKHGGAAQEGAHGDQSQGKEAAQHGDRDKQAERVG